LIAGGATALRPPGALRETDLPLVQRIQPRAVALLELVPADLEARRHLLVGDGEGLVGEGELADDSIIIGTQILLPLLKEGGKARKGGASIVNFSSVGGLRGAPFNAAYCTSKAAVKMLSKCMGAEFSALGYNIRCNSVHPGGIETGMLNSIMDRYVELGASPSREVSYEGMVAAHPIGRLGRPDEMGGGVVYLCSEAASFVTCSEFLMDGGFSQV